MPEPAVPATRRAGESPPATALEPCPVHVQWDDMALARHLLLTALFAGCTALSGRPEVHP